MLQEEFTARPYQQAIIDVCINRNSIIFLPTGAGKTFIAVQVIRHFAEAIERKYSKGGRRSVFLVNTVVLAKQQEQNIADMVPYKVSLLCGEQNVDYWKEHDWLNLLEDSQILVSTAQVILDAVKKSFIKLEQINVLIFDECHHGRKDHAYHELMKQFRHVPRDNVRVIGLSGMLIGNDSKLTSSKVIDELQQLEATYQSTIISVNTLDDHRNVLLHSTNAEESVLKFSSHFVESAINEVSNVLAAVSTKLENVNFYNYATINPKTLRRATPSRLKDIVNMFNDFIYQSKDMGAMGGYLSLRGILVQLKLVHRCCDSNKYKHIVEECISVVETSIQQLEKFKLVDKSSLIKNFSDKVIKLFKLLAVKFKDSKREKDLQCIVFVKRRTTARGLYHALKAYSSLDTNFPIKPDFIVGVNNEIPESIEAILSTHYNSQALEKFRKKETNVIISSSVLEEGIDLQMCNIVVMYDKPDTYRSYVQTRGRARVNNSNYIILIADETSDKFTNKLLTWRKVDDELKKELLMRTLDREPPSEEAINKEREDVWPPFITKNGSILNNVNAVNLLNHYASKMPSDRFSNLKVYWRRIEREGGKVSAGLQLPFNSTVKEEVIGDPQNHVRLAKQHAAFKACIKLYNNGELNDSLIPVDEKQKIEIHNDEYFSHWTAYSNDIEKAGTRNHRRYHHIKTPKVLEDSGPEVLEKSFIYRIEVRPDFDTSDRTQKIFEKLMNNKNEFGILISKRLPAMCSMKLFQTFGKINVQISHIPIEVELKSKNELNTLQNFHVTIFKDVLSTWQNYFVLDKTSYLIVPLTEDLINWDLANEFQALEQRHCLTYGEVREADFSSMAYLNRLICPVYKNAGQKYVILDVIDKPSQMLEAIRISFNLNLFFPPTRCRNRKCKIELFAPEICHYYKFPADYWLKATLLSSVCHRMHYMLLAEELRKWLIDEKIDLNLCPQNLILDVDFGNCKEREIKMMEMERQCTQTHGKFDNILDLKQHNDQESSLPATESNYSNFTMWNGTKIPTDVDRNWLSITELDLKRYSDFVNYNRRNVAAFGCVQQPNNGAILTNRFFVRSNDQQEIRILNMHLMCGTVQQKDLIKVLTASNTRDVFDLERLEVLGDGFLKFITSLYLYKKYDEWHEGHLSALKAKIISNRNLYYVGNDFELSGMVKSSRFNASTSLPPSIKISSYVQAVVEDDKMMLTNMRNIEAFSREVILSGSIGNLADKFIEQCGRRNPRSEHDILIGDEINYLHYINQHYIGDKVVADAVEAFLGVVVQSIGVQGGYEVCQKLKILPKDEHMNNLLTEKILPRPLLQNNSPNEVRISNQHELEKIIGYHFKEPKYLLQALTHASYPIKAMGSYQQLEFLGDAVLDFLVTSYICERCTILDPGKLTDLRSAVVNNVTLACIIVRNKIHKYLLFSNELLAKTIKKFAVYLSSKNNHVVLDQIILLGTEDDTMTSETIEVPKVIGDLFESIVGAVFLDSGLNLNTTWNVIYGLLKQELHEFMQNIPVQIIRQLYEYEKGSAEPKFFDAQVLEDGSVAVPLKFNCGIDENGIVIEKLVVGFAKNKLLAKKSAAKMAMKALRAIKKQ